MGIQIRPLLIVATCLAFCACASTPSPQGASGMAGGKARPLRSDPEASVAPSTGERLTAELSFISLAGFQHTDPVRIVEAVTGLMALMLPRQEIVWGPAVHHPWQESPVQIPTPSDALAFICRDLDSGEFHVVFRGTNPVSPAEWLFQDFMVQKQVPWRQVQAGPAPEEALVSEGTATAVCLRRDLCPASGAKGEGRSLAAELIDILERSDGRCVMHFTGHSLGGLLASTMALWLVDRLTSSGRDDLLGKLDVDVSSYAAPTAGNRPFAEYCASRVPEHARYACDLDIVPRAWGEATLEDLPSLYMPDIGMQGITRSVFDFCLGLVREKGYVHSGALKGVPSRVVPVESGLYLLEAIYQHAIPYLDMLEPERKETIIREVFKPIYGLVPVKGILPADVEGLFTADGSGNPPPGVRTDPRDGPGETEPSRRPGGTVPEGQTGH